MAPANEGVGSSGDGLVKMVWRRVWRWGMTKMRGGGRFDEDGGDEDDGDVERSVASMDE